MVLYPAVGAVAVDAWPRLPAFGITPCPLTLFTLGLPLFARRSGALMLIPLLWSAIGASATFQLGTVQDSLLAAALLVLSVLMAERWCGGRRAGHSAF